MKLTTGVNFTNILSLLFCTQVLCTSYYVLTYIWTAAGCPRNSFYTPLSPPRKCNRLLYCTLNFLVLCTKTQILLHYISFWHTFSAFGTLSHTFVSFSTLCRFKQIRRTTLLLSWNRSKTVLLGGVFDKLYENVVEIDYRCKFHKHNILRAPFSYKSVLRCFYLLTILVRNFLSKENQRNYPFHSNLSGFQNKDLLEYDLMQGSSVWKYLIT